ncbi:MAG TPA: MFS transporter [Symbiobacteriaceae bacterium]|nr:MFS transporter [Symbiobacteriaceae bacterium]
MRDGYLHTTVFPGGGDLNRRALAVLSAVLFLVMTGFSILFPVLPHYARQVGASEAQWGWIVAAYSFMQFLFSPYWGALSDRVGRKRVLLAGLAGYVATFLALAFAHTLLQVFVVRALSGALTAATLPTAMAYVGDNTTKEERAKGMGVLGAAMGLGVIFGPMIGAFLSHISLATPFLASAGSGAVTFLLALTFLPESRPVYTGPRPSRWALIRGQMGALNLVSFCTSFLIAGFEATFALFIYDRFAMGQMSQGYLFGVIGIGSAVMQGAVAHRFMKRFGDEAAVVGGMGLIAFGLVLVIAAWNPSSLYPLVLVYGFGHGMVRPAVATLVSKRAVQQGVAIGAMDAMDSMGRVVGPIIAGFAYGHFGMTSPYWIGVAVVLAAMVAFLNIRPSQEAPEAS